MSDSGPAPTIAVIGAGFSGLAAALELQRRAAEYGRQVDVSAFEAGPRPGGLVHTQRIGDYLVERGADSFITNKPAAVTLCRQLGLESRLIGTDPRFRKSFILRRGRPVATPAGFQLLAPTRFWPLVKSPLLSWRGKLRVLREMAVPPRKEATDESLASFVRRRFGQEALDRIVQPLVGGIYTSDPERLSLAATMPRFLEMERRHGSVIRALRRSTVDDAGAHGARYGLFVSLPGGMEELLSAMAERFQSQLGALALQTEVSSVRRLAPGAGWELTTPAGPRRFDALILAIPAYRAAALIESHSPGLAAALNEIEYASSAIVVTGHRLADIRHPLDGAGMVIPHIEQRRILAVSFASRKFPGRAPEGRVILRTFVGGAMQPELLAQDDPSLVRIVLAELRDLLGAEGEPDFTEVVRYGRGMPQYHVGHLERVNRIDEAAAKLPGFALCGNAYRGVGIPDAIASGTAAADAVWRSLPSQTGQPAGPPAD
ncbi:MAG: protoporphyrinogen oxidase [Planctomyces sp.]|nr:protoporphyrinogen oxidase [Planctomyces sp.]